MTLAKTEGIFTEPAGGVSIAALKKLVDDGFIEQDEKVVCYVTGNGLKSIEAIMSALPKLDIVKPDVNSVRNDFIGIDEHRMTNIEFIIPSVLTKGSGEKRFH